ncbi:MAG: TonB-dependent receptor, partial [Bacteroidia bacterium]|nr:TonB-dependent receptor [Bacteroidia bacterium]
LSPNRTSNFNVRQNGYDISADALGYPESYYTPPVEALERIEIVRGAASLQYGTQFGGMLNFNFKKGEKDKKISLTSRQTVGSWGFFSTFNSLGGTVGKLNYYVYYQYKTGAGYRPNSGFQYHNAYASLHYQATQKLNINIDVTKMTYLAQQPGGLTDRQFQENPRQSNRERNWFSVDWNLLALNFTYKFNDQTQLNWRNFGLLAQRQALGNLERINVADFGRERTLIAGRFQNFGSEIRLLHKYPAQNQKHTLLIGSRFYRGTTTAKQGFGSAGRDADFRFLNPNNVEDSDYVFPNENYALFAENIFNLNEKLSITPGIRFENIRTFAQGFYNRYVKDAAGNIIVSNQIQESLNRKRSFVILGVGTSYKPFEKLEFYANISQNYRAINFSDLRINNPNLRVDANIQDEKGYTADLGIRGKQEDFFTYEVTFFYLKYLGKIGQVLKTDSILFNDYRFRTNVSNARNLGIEAFAEWNILKMLNPSQQFWQWNMFVNFAWIDARYVGTQDNAIRNKKVEMVPPTNLKIGNTLKYKNVGLNVQYIQIQEHFSDASNTRRTASAIEGIIPSYHVADISFFYRYKFLTWECSINNLLNEQYFTRRAEGYPGPGIIPADGRGFYTTLQVKF